MLTHISRNKFIHNKKYGINKRSMDFDNQWKENKQPNDTQS